MEQRLANSWRMTVNERKFIEHALLSDLRVDGRRPFDYRRLTIKFGREDGSSEVQLGQTHVMGFVTSQLVQPYRDRPNEGTLSIFTEFSPMADPSFEAGRPGEFAVELGRIIDRGLRESRAVDTESLCVLAGKLVWAIRVDLHIIDNGGNLVDAANIAALAALSTFRRPECTLGGEDGQEVIVHPHEVREPLPLIIHHLPIAVTFAFFGDGEIVVIDPTHKEEVVMGGRMTATLNTNGDVCAVQKAGGVGAMRGVIMQCMRVASVKATDITDKIRNAVEAYNLERSLRKIKRHPPLDAQKIDGADLNMSGSGDQVVAVNQDIGGSSRNSEKMLNEEDDKSYSSSENDGVDGNTGSSQVGDVNGTQKNVNLFTGGPSSWDPYSKGIAFSKFFKGSTGPLTSFKEQEERSRIQNLTEPMQVEPAVDPNAVGSTPIEGSSAEQQICHNMTLRDAVKVKHRRKKNASSAKNRT